MVAPVIVHEVSRLDYLEVSLSEQLTDFRPCTLAEVSPPLVTARGKASPPAKSVCRQVRCLLDLIQKGQSSVNHLPRAQSG